MRVPSKDPKIAADYPRPTAKEFRAHRDEWTDPFFGVHMPGKDPGDPAYDELRARLKSVDDEPVSILRALGFLKGQEPKNDKKWREILKYDQLEQDKEDAPHGGVGKWEGPGRGDAPYVPWEQRNATSGADPMQARRPSGVADFIRTLESMGIVPSAGKPGGRLRQMLGIKGDYIDTAPEMTGYKQDVKDWK